MDKRSSIGQVVRKRLSDITNTQTQLKLIGTEDKQTETAQDMILSEDYVNSLLKENVTLVNLVAERNKIIEASEAELQKLRINCQKLQLQNWSLAQLNSQMLAEVNLGRERIKAMQHELACKNAVLKAKHQELEENIKSITQQMDLQVEDIAAKAENRAKSNDKPSCRRVMLRSRSMEPIMSNEQATKDNTENKRPCLKRQSARFRSQEKVPSEDSFELEDVKFSVEENSKNSSGKSRLIKNEVKNGNCVPSSAPQEFKRTSLGRPLRRAAEKVQSYKELSVKIKMRRPE